MEEESGSMAGKLDRGSTPSNAEKLFGRDSAVFSPSRETLWALRDWGTAWVRSAAVGARRALDRAPNASAPATKPSRKPVAVLLPGVWENWEVLSSWGRALSAVGFDVRFVPALDLQLGSIKALSQVLADFLATNELENALVVAHSKGGLVAKKAMGDSEGWRVRRLISCGTPFEGAPIAALSPKLLRMRSLVPQDPEIRELGASTQPNKRIVAIEAKWDQNVPRTTSLPGGKVVTANVRGHHSLLHAPEALALIVRYALLD